MIWYCLPKLFSPAVVSWPVPLITLLKATEGNDSSHCKNENNVSVPAQKWQVVWKYCKLGRSSLGFVIISIVILLLAIPGRVSPLVWSVPKFSSNFFFPIEGFLQEENMLRQLFLQDAGQANTAVTTLLLLLLYIMSFWRWFIFNFEMLLSGVKTEAMPTYGRRSLIQNCNSLTNAVILLSPLPSHIVCFFFFHQSLSHFEIKTQKDSCECFPDCSHSPGSTVSRQRNRQSHG